MNFTRTDFPPSFQFGLSSMDEGAELNAAGFDIYRVPIPWGDRTALDRCEAQVDNLLELGVRPCGILDHSALPLHAIDCGGWSNRDTAARFADFAETAMRRLGDRLYSVGTGAQTQVTPHSTTRAQVRGLHHRLLAHGMAVEVLRGYGATNLGFAFGPENADTEASAVFTKSYLPGWLAAHEQNLPDQWELDLPLNASPIDWCILPLNDIGDKEVLKTIPRDHPVYLTFAAADKANLAAQLDHVKEALGSGFRIKGLFVLSENQPVIDTWRDDLNKSGSPAPWVRTPDAVHAHWNLVADIGGTNTRLGVVTDGKLTSLHKHPTGTNADLHTALHDLCVARGTPPRAVVAAGAGPVRDGTIHLTNAHLTLSETELAEATQSEHTFVINDFTAAAWSVAEIAAADVDVLQGASTPPLGTRLVVGPGTGLGVGALVFSEGHFHTVSGEGGHMGLSPRHRDEVDVFEAARQLAPDCFFGDSLTLEAEMFLSGTGLPILYQAVGMASGQTKPPVKTAKDILQAAQDSTDVCAVRTARIFTEHLGAIIGDLAVALVPRGGVFLVGGVAEKNRWLFGQDFLDAFNAGGRFSTLRQEMNLYISRQDEFGIVGANNFCKNALAH